MSRRTGHGGRPRHPEHRGGPRPHDPTRSVRPTAATEANPDGALGELPFIDPERPAGADLRADVAYALGPAPRDQPPVAPLASDAIPADHEPSTPGPDEPPRSAPVAGRPVTNRFDPRPAPPAGPPAGDPGSVNGERLGGCTSAQLRRFIKSRAYVPMHEIRRRFLIASEDDDVSGIELEGGRIFVGLPAREGQMLGELLRGGEIGFELQLDPMAPVVVGVYPMRPVTRS
jgi:hypothetical protein